MITADSLPDDVASLQALGLAGRAALAEATTAQLAAEAKARNLEAQVRARALLIEQMKFTIAKLKHEQYEPSSERSSVLDQLELELADLEEDASEAEAEARLAVSKPSYQARHPGELMIDVSFTANGNANETSHPPAALDRPFEVRTQR